MVWLSVYYRLGAFVGVLIPGMSRKVNRGLLYLLAAGLAACTKANFNGPASGVNTQTVTIVGSSLNYSTPEGVPLQIPKSDIAAAVTKPTNDSIADISISQSNGSSQLVDEGDHYSFVSANVGSVRFSYLATDINHLTANSSITIQVLAVVAPTPTPVQPTPAPTPPGNATAYYYAVGNSQLYELSADNQSIHNTVTTTYLGRPIALNDLAINQNGEVYAKDLNGNGIYRLNAVTGVATLVVQTIPNSNGPLLGLSFFPDGTLVTVQLDGTVLSFKLNTMKTSQLIKTAYFMLGGDIKLLPDGNAYWTVSNGTSQLCQDSNGPGTQALVQLNPVTGKIKEIGCLDQPSIFGLGFAHGVVYGFTGDGNVVTINTANAKTTIVAAPGFAFWGAASNPALW